MYQKFDMTTLSKIMLNVLGNHDYWLMGSPDRATFLDQFGNGMMQWYAQARPPTQQRPLGSRHRAAKGCVDSTQRSTELMCRIRSLRGTSFLARPRLLSTSRSTPG